MALGVDLAPDRFVCVADRDAELPVVTGLPVAFPRVLAGGQPALADIQSAALYLPSLIQAWFLGGDQREGRLHHCDPL